MSPYSLNREDRKLAGVCSTLGALFNVDPTFLRIGFVAAVFLISWEVALVSYVAAGIFLHLKKRQSRRRQGAADRGASDYERMAQSPVGRSSIHDLRRLEPEDRRLMAIDHHLNAPNDELAREIEALRGDQK